MKKLFTFIVGAVVGLGAYAQDFESGDLVYTVLSPDDKTCAVIGMGDVERSSITSLTIPSTVLCDGEEYTVTEIGADACTSLDNMTELNLPETLKYIGYEAFSGCNSLPSLIIPNSVETIYAYAFEYSYNLRTVILGESLNEIAPYPFSGAPITAVATMSTTPPRLNSGYGTVFPSGAVIGVLYNSAEVMDAYKEAWPEANIVAYKAADALSFNQTSYSAKAGETIQLDYTVDPEDAPVGFSVITDQDKVAIGKDGIISVSPFLSNDITVTVTAGTLNGLTADCELNIKGSPQFNVDGIEYSVYPGEEKEVVLSAVYECPASFVIPETVEYNGETYTVAYIKDDVMQFELGLEELTIPATVKSIGNYCFRGCRNLSKVTISDSNEPLELGIDLFNFCKSLSTFYLGRNVMGSALNMLQCNINRVILGSCVTEVPDAFGWNVGTISIVESFNPLPPALIGDCFNNNRVQIKVIVPEEYVEAYQEAWGDFGFGSIGAEKEVTELAFAEDEVTIYAGEKIKLPLVVEPEDATIIWSSSNPYLIGVEDDGTIYVENLTQSGDITITASSLNGLSAECHVRLVKWFDWSESSITMSLGETKQLEVIKTEKFEALDVPVEWIISSGAECVSIDQKTSTITATDFGHAFINAMAKIEIDGRYYDIFSFLEVDVVEYPSSVTAETSEITVYKDTNAYIGLSFEPDGENVDKTINWTVENPEIAEVQSGWGGEYYVYGLETGTTTIVGETLNGLKVEIFVKVIGQIDDLTFNTNYIYVAPEGTFQLEYTTVPEDAQQAITFTSGDEGVATVDPETGLVTGVDFGNTYIYAYAENGWSWSIPVQVCVMPESVKFVGSTDYVGTMTDWTYFHLEFLPDDPNVCKHIDWTADDPEIAFIDTDNSFQGRNFGTTAFRGVAVNGDVLEGTITIEGLKILVNGEGTRWKEVYLGDEFKLDVEASSENLLENVQLFSDNENVVTVAEDGTVNAVGIGRANVIVRSTVEIGENELKEYSTYIQITVNPKEGIALNTDNVILTPGNWSYVSVLRGENEGWSEITWSSSDENVVAITWGNNNEAELTYVGPGQATVSATDENGNVATCEVTCYGIIITPVEVEMLTNSTFQLEVKAFPENANIESIEWTSQDPEFVSVDENGLITTNDIIGLTRIYASTSIDGWYVESACDVRVNAYIPVTEITLNETSISAVEGDEVQLIATINPEDATNKDLIWKSSDDSVATVDENGLVKILSVGGATISVYAVDNMDVYATCTIYGTTGVNGILSDDVPFDIYNMNGILIKKDATSADFKQLAPDFYLIKKGEVVVKIKR